MEKGKDCFVRERRGDEGLGIDGLDGRTKNLAGVAPKPVVRVCQ